jgi:hypothetical protein
VEEVLRLPAEAELVASWGRPPPGDGAAGGSNLVGVRLSSFRHMAFDLLYAPSTLLPTGCPRLARSQSPVPRTAPPCCRSNNALFDPVARSCWPGAASRSPVYVPYAVTLSVSHPHARMQQVRVLCLCCYALSFSSWLTFFLNKIVADLPLLLYSHVVLSPSSPSILPTYG